ncbi:unnamed protein product [Ilex paraguariensis]|uniref:AP2/ERF domain-containing protein n=1 Tax=Ilex paraguariensis TaxID=185542 RepID=A0ABC8SVP7_9AQUA
MANPANVRQNDPRPKPLILGLDPPTPSNDQPLNPLILGPGTPKSPVSKDDQAPNSSLPIVCEDQLTNQPHPQPQPPTPTVLSPSVSGGTSGRHPYYRGIRWRSGKWVSEIREPRKTTRIWLGTYPQPEMAAAAYDVAALALKGADATLNFPDFVLSYPIPASSSASDIRAAAASAAALRAPRPEAGGPSGPEKEEPGQPEEVVLNTETSGQEFMDEEALFDMPNLLVDMAEGMLVSPPRMKSQSYDDSPENSDGESLWTYS